MTIALNDLLMKEGVDPATTLVMRHRPTEQALRRVLPWLAQEHEDVYNAYQSQHGARTEAALARATHLASFIGHEPGRALFVNLCGVRGARAVTRVEFWNKPENKLLGAYGTRGPASGTSPLLFDLRTSDRLAALKGRLVIGWTGIERSWWRWAARNTLPVLAIHQESVLARRLPDWKALVLTWQELQLIPASWRTTLAQWRGIYLIHDAKLGKGYVGSAYGSANLLGRWNNYAESGHGGNRLLKARSPENFQFSILERVSPDMSPEDVVAVESSWKARLHTRAPLGLNDN